MNAVGGACFEPLCLRIFYFFNPVKTDSSFYHGLSWNKYYNTIYTKGLTRRCYQKKQEVSRECSPGEERSPVQMRNVWLCRELWGPVHAVQQSCNSPKPWPCQCLRSSVMGYLPSKCVIFRFVWCFPEQTNRALLTDAANLWSKDHSSAIYWDSRSPSVKTFQKKLCLEHWHCLS